MKKIFKRVLPFTLAVMMVLTVVACGTGGGGNGGTQNDPPANSPTNNDPVTTPNGGGDSGGTSGDNGNGGDTNPPSASIPNNGTPPNVPVPFEAHEGDKGYFYVDTDDWAVFMHDIVFDVRNPAYSYAPAVQYIVFSFDDTDFTVYGKKWVFESEANAESFAKEDSSYIAIGNVVYVDYGSSRFMTEAFGKLTHVELNFKNVVWAHGGNAHLSKPTGFEELLADNTMKGRTGSMTLREAFAYAGYNTLPDTSDFNYDSVTDFNLRFRRDESFKGFDADLIILDGDTEILNSTFFFFDDSSKETTYRVRDYLPGWDRLSHMEGVLATRRGGQLAYMGIE